MGVVSIPKCVVIFNVPNGFDYGVIEQLHLLCVEGSGLEDFAVSQPPVKPCLRYFMFTAY